MKVEDRNMEKEDIASIVEILNALFSGKWYRKITPDFFREKVIENPYFSFKETSVVIIEKKAVGFAVHISKDKEIGYLHSLGVRKEYQNKGIGAKLLERTEKIVKEKGERELQINFSAPAKLYLGIDSEDKKTIDFFLHQGYKTREGYYSEGIYVLSLKDYSIPEKILQREKDLEKEGYKIRLVENDKRIPEFCRKNGEENWAISPPSLATVMEKNGEVIGFCGYTLKDEKRMGIGESIPEWGPFLVSTEQRGKGIGTVIICCSLKEMSGKGCSSTFLETGGSKSEGPGPRIYRKLGFRLVKEWVQMYKVLY